jgi:predicted phage baseplate assembly protein
LVPASAFDKDEPVDGRTWLLADGNASFKVEVETDGSLEPWQGGRLDEAGPNDWRYSIEEQPDGSGIAVRFGNGVNGRRPGLNDAIKISAQLSTGSEGNVRKPIEWLLESQRLHLRNNFPIAGGTDAEGVADALRRASGRLRENRVLASAKQLIEALAPVLTPLEIKRADVEEGWEEGRRTPSVVATRTLLVAHERPGGESAEWLRTISRYLVARIAVGERLIVKAPKYLAFGVSVVVDPVPGSARGVVEKSVRDELNRRFIKPKDWPLGRDVDASAVSGWIRSAEGVAAVIDLRLIVGGRPCDHLPIGHGELPQFDEPADVTVREQPR